MSEANVELVGYKEHTHDSKDEEPASKDAPKDAATEPQEIPNGDDRSSSAVKLEPSDPADVPKPKSAVNFETNTKVDLSAAAPEQM